MLCLENGVMGSWGNGGMGCLSVGFYIMLFWVAKIVGIPGEGILKKNVRIS
jgi:hypothetical protein